MNRILSYALIASAALGGTLYAALGQAGPPVVLQATTPGTQQLGNANVSGKVIAGGFSATNSNPTAQVFVGNATSTTGANYGGLFRTDSSTGTGIRGVASATTGAANGGTFQSGSPNGAGVRGNATSPTGVNYGVYGKAVSPNGFAVFADGRLSATGVISGNGSGLTSVNAALLGGLSSSAFLQSIPVPLNLTGSGAHIIRAQNTDPDSGAAVIGLASAGTGVTAGGRFESASDEGIGILGLSTTTIANGFTSGVHGQAANPVGRGVFGRATNGGGANYGVWGQSDSTIGRGVYGFASATSGANYGGYFLTDSSGTNAAGVFGLASAATGTTTGVWGKSNSSGGYGVAGTNDSSTGTTFGVYGRSASQSGFGVYGINTMTEFGGTGVFGAGGGNFAGYGVYGQATGVQGYGVYAQGPLGASGTKSFRIDHPHDPENKYLLHYSTESPTPQNFYVGNVVTDAKGYGWVELPDYFEDINKNFKYQLTVVDDKNTDEFVMAKVALKIKDGRFLIRTSSPRVEVSWRVDADRNDLWVQRNPPKDVADKKGREKGTYQHPELYGLGPERGMNYNSSSEKQRKDPPVAQTRKR